MVDVLEWRPESGGIALVAIGDILIPGVVSLLFWRNRQLRALLRS